MIRSMARVLIAEPSADVRALLERAVRRLGHEPVVHKRRGLARDTDADVLLLEPAFNGGVELAHSLRRDQPQLAIVICSIFPPSEELHDLKPAAYVLKPFLRDTLEDALQTAITASA
jgi:CheY-like chemotaxis protein